ncbi:RNA polymerase subunit sigma-24 [Niabella ginsenosidivorans]|uniref:RNA polymerase subunit sigma-24 n=1 Tax=Niabella ginsenosidivorans TaxID=1176587 RepID=A0A1A9I5D6_9BACT|nr:RNA polymerase sigma factor [Niabella ginsenosidivorans]ANH82888.1 RNA polymerase subunit sigma-24 [Niabella ginsenosidivorans]
MQEQKLSILAEEKDQNIIQAVKDYGNRLFGFIRKNVNTDADAEDILQDVWYQYANVSATQTIEQVSGWLFKVARNKITDKYRKKKADLIDDYQYENEDGEVQFRELLFTLDNDPELADIKKLFWEELFGALDELPENQRQVFVLNELEDMTLQEIADQYGENIKTIISRKRYAVQHLRNRLQYLYDELINY